MSVARPLAAGVATIALVTSCLSSLPDPIACPAAARLPAVNCPAPQAGPNACALPIACLESQGRTCQCTDACSPVPSKDTCSAPPSCPDSVKQKAPRALCFVATLQPAGAPPGTSSCVCGCLSCASLCDGFGPIVGAGPQGGVTVGLPNDSAPGGRMGVMVRARGTADVSGVFAGGPTPAQASARVDSNDDFAEVLLAPAAPPGPQASSSQVMINSTAPIEIDCVVPYIMP